LKNLKVSVLIANYNNKMYINECIRSLQNQTYENIEIIFHDDFSSDNSLDKINKFKNIKIIKNKKRNKVGSFNQIEAYKRAFKKSTGDIIFLLDSDDFFAKNKIETIVKFFSNNKKLVSVFDLPILKYGQNLIFKKNKKKIIKNFWPYIPPQSCISIRRKNFIKIIGNIDYKIFPDIWMDFRIALYLIYVYKNFFILEQNLTYYRQSANMISSEFSFFSISWLKRRMQAHKYIKYFFLKQKITYHRNLDYFLTSIINYFI
jgi:glycosyltransferase involved in cell wall biosynthesis